MGEETEGRPLFIDSGPRTRGWVYADITSVSTRGDTARLDFMLTDSLAEDAAHAVLSARVFLTLGDLINLRNLIDTHLMTMSGKAEGATDASE